VSVVYSDITACVLNNGFTTDYFSLNRGIRQGCPLSAYLFILAVEYLASSIRNDANIRGIMISDREIKIVQMADDTTLFLQDVASLNTLFRKLHIFRLASGLKLNKTKTEAIWLGSNVGSSQKPCDIEWVTEAYALGIWFYTDIERGVNRNFAEQYDQFNRALNMWKARDLSIKGKIAVIKTIALPILLYVASNLPVPQLFIDNVTKEMYSFVWSGKPEKIKRNTLISDICNGGLKMVDFRSMVKAQKVMWVKRLLSEENVNASWKAFPCWCLGKIGTSLLRCHFDPQNIPMNLPAFYHQVLQSWAQIHGQEKIMSAWDVRRQPFMFNKHVMIDDEYVWKRFSCWLEKGIFLIHDIVDSKGTFLSIDQLRSLYDIEIDVLLYNGLKNAIPREWRHLLKQITITREAIPCDEGVYIVQADAPPIPVSLLTNKLVYKMFLQPKIVQPICIEKWTSLYMDEFCWKDIFQLPYSTVRCTHLQTLQYKILYRIYPCNYWVSKWDPTIDKSCDRCGMEDTIQHFFHNCPKVHDFWHFLQTWWACNMHKQIQLSEQDVIFGYFRETQHEKAINFCILHAKQFISTQIYRGYTPFFLAFLVKMKHHLLVEKCICTRNDTLNSFEDSLEPLLEKLL
jgi:hypothetical protein